jgi:hypothetical protein
MGRKRVLLGVAITVVLALLVVTPSMAGAWGNCGYSNCSYGNYGYMNNYGHMSHYGYGNNYSYGKSGYSNYGRNYSYGLYRVQWGDTLNKIAARYGVSTGYLQWLNGIADPNVIYAGEVLRVPGYYAGHAYGYASGYSSGYRSCSYGAC